MQTTKHTSLHLLNSVQTGLSTNGVAETPHDLGGGTFAPTDSVMVEGVSILMDFLFNAEAEHLCGAALYEQNTGRVNYRAGYHSRSLRTRFGKATVHIPHLRWVCVRPSMAKRFKRVEPLVLGILDECLRHGVFSSRVEELIKALWTVELPAPLLTKLTQQIVHLLQPWCLQHGAASAAFRKANESQPTSPSPAQDAHEAGYAVS